jgi:hypothetical protein
MPPLGGRGQVIYRDLASGYNESLTRGAVMADLTDDASIPRPR